MKFSDALRIANERPAGFDYLRMLLAISIIGFHSIVTCYGSAIQAQVLNSAFGWVFNLILPMFFALSGFLVAGSLERNSSIVRFIWLRACRIYPALTVDTVLCALILGPLLTTLSMADYFSSHVTWAYMANALGLIHYELPGVFTANPAPKVNAQLWTIPIELECYAALAAMGVLKLHRRPVVFAMLVLLLCLTWGGWGYFSVDAAYTRSLVPARVLVMSFLAGVGLYLCRHRVPYGLPGFLLAMAAFLACVIEPRWVYLAAIPAAYATCYLGCLRVRRHWLIERFDVSYGLFLYGYPVQQVIVHLGGEQIGWQANILYALPCTFALAWASLRFVERPAQQRMRGWVR